MAPPPQEEGAVDSVVWGITNQPVTFERPPPQNLEQSVPNPGIPRANRAPSDTFPNPPKLDQTPLEAHVAFWDKDNDGIIYPRDTYQGFKEIGFNFFLAIIAAIIIHSGFAYWSQPYWLPNPLFPLYVKRIHRCKHGSDSETYDTEGRFVPEKFEEIFTKYAKSHKDALTKADIVAMLRGNRNVMDPFGWGAAIFEWGILYWVAKDERGLLTKERVRANYDGSLFYVLKSDVLSHKSGKGKAHQKVQHERSD